MAFTGGGSQCLKLDASFTMM